MTTNDIDEKKQLRVEINYGEKIRTLYKINIPACAWCEYRDSRALDAVAFPFLIARYISYAVHLMAYRSSGWVDKKNTLHQRDQTGNNTRPLRQILLSPPHQVTYLQKIYLINKVIFFITNNCAPLSDKYNRII